MPSVGRTVKESMMQTLGAHLAERPNVFVTTLRLQAPEADGLRQQLHASHARLVMIKRRLGRRTVEPLKIAGLAELLEGSVGFIFAGGDTLPLAKLLVEFQKAHEERLVIRGALIDGQLLDQRRVEHLATLPPKPQLLAQVVLTVESPIVDVVFTVERLIGDLIWNVDQAAAAAPPPSSASQPNAS